MPLEKITDNVYSVGAQHFDRELFDALMPLHYGTTYNSYFIQGTKANALIDPVEPEKIADLLKNLEDLQVKKIDYIINLHTEQDHSGGTPFMLQRWPDAQLVGTAKVAELAELHLHLPKEKYMLVKDNDKLELGGKTLVFRSIPFAHWPDNTTAFLEEDNIIFTSDLFGSHLACGSMYNDDVKLQIRAARDYFAEIMMPFSTQCAKYTKWVKELNPSIIAAAHGPLWRNPSDILDKYEEWTGDKRQRETVIGYVSMHSSTQEMIQRLILRLKDRNMPYTLYNLAAHRDSMSVAVGEMAGDLVEAGGLILAAPTVLVNPHPACLYAAAVVNTLKPKIKVAGFMSSYAWASKAEQFLTTGLSAIKAETLPVLMVKGAPTEKDFERVDEFANAFVDKMDELCK